MAKYSHIRQCYRPGFLWTAPPGPKYHFGPMIQIDRYLARLIEPMEKPE